MNFPKPIKYLYTKNRRHYWEYECACGNRFVRYQADVNSGRVSDCGCSSSYNFKGKLFGRLTATEYVKGGKWHCVCSCGNEVVVKTDSLTRGKTKSCGCYRDEVKRRRKVSGDIADRVDALYKKAYVQLKNRHLRGLKFSVDDLISFEEWKSIVDQPCFYCGTQPSRELFDRLSDTKLRISGVDRVDASKGYVLGNVLPCCWSCNIAKSDMTLREFARMIRRLSDNLEAIELLDATSLQ